jgi:heme/copper-type cytochrome/quinol oxidase subunit 4
MNFIHLSSIFQGIRRQLANFIALLGLFNIFFAIFQLRMLYLRSYIPGNSKFGKHYYAYFDSLYFRFANQVFPRHLMSYILMSIIVLLCFRAASSGRRNSEIGLNIIAIPASILIFQANLFLHAYIHFNRTIATDVNPLNVGDRIVFASFVLIVFCIGLWILHRRKHGMVRESLDTSLKNH